MNTKTAGVITLITFLVALVVIVWILVSSGAGRTDSYLPRATPGSVACTGQSSNSSAEGYADAYE